MHGTATDPLTYPHPVTPKPGELTEVAPGILWLRLALPFQLNHVNIYLIEHDGGWAVVDTGIGTDQTKATWDAVLSGPLKGAKLTRLIVTHSHPDHIGLAGWLAERFKCPLTMTQTEYFNGLFHQTRRTEIQVQDQAEFYRIHGIGEEGINALLGRGSNYLTRTTGLPPKFFRAKDGDTLDVGTRTLRSLHRRRSRARADDAAVARRTSCFCPPTRCSARFRRTSACGRWNRMPIRSASTSSRCNRLARDIPDDVLVLPGHGVPFYGLKIRIKQLLDHHVERCGDDRQGGARDVADRLRHGAADLPPAARRASGRLRHRRGDCSH